MNQWIRIAVSCVPYMLTAVTLSVSGYILYMLATYHSEPTEMFSVKACVYRLTGAIRQETIQTGCALYQNVGGTGGEQCTNRNGYLHFTNLRYRHAPRNYRDLL
jgi:hypothetical protein